MVVRGDDNEDDERREQVSAPGREVGHEGGEEYELWIERQRQTVEEQTARVRGRAERADARASAVVLWVLYREKRRELEQTVACDTSYWVLLWRQGQGCWEVSK